MMLMFTVSCWDWVDVEVVVLVVEAAAMEVVGGRSRGAGTGGPEPAADAMVAAGPVRDWVPLAKLLVRMLQRLSEELLRPDWLFASLPRSCWSR